MGGEGGQFEAVNMVRCVSLILKLPVVLLHLGLPQVLSMKPLWNQEDLVAYETIPKTPGILDRVHHKMVHHCNTCN
jgi:hypothetical protein